MKWTVGPEDTWNGMATWLKQLGSSIPVKPRAIIVVSAHWEESEVTINSSARPGLLYDYYGFPDETYRLKYEAAGSPTLAQKISVLLAESGIPAQTVTSRGLDHGVFIPLKIIYPEADIPIVQVSLKRGLDPYLHIQVGRALAPLRSEDILIIGSGMSYHNLSRFGLDSGGQISIAFDDWLTSTICNIASEKRNRLLCEWEKAPAARSAHPRAEHLIPLMVAAGAAGADSGQRIFSEPVLGLAISAFQFG